MGGKGFAMDPKRIAVAEAPAGKDAYRTKQRKLPWPCFGSAIHHHPPTNPAIHSLHPRTPADYSSTRRTGRKPWLPMREASGGRGHLAATVTGVKGPLRMTRSGRIGGSSGPRGLTLAESV